MLKKCNKCNHKLSVNEFYKNKNKKDGLSSICKYCNYEYHKEYNQRPERKIANQEARKRLLATDYWICGGGKISNLRRREQKRGRSFNLTVKQLRIWWKNTPDKCFYCGCSTNEFLRLRNFLLEYQGQKQNMKNYRCLLGNKNSSRTKYLTIDRLNNTIGYEIENIVKACWFCNHLKGFILTPEETLLIAPRIIGRLQDELRP